jgi:hypothetical protein
MSISFGEFPLKRQPKSVGASKHPADAEVHFGCCFLAMLLTYNILLDHIANFLIYLSGTPSFWLLLNTSYDHGCHLERQFQSGGDSDKVGREA